MTKTSEQWESEQAYSYEDIDLWDWFFEENYDSTVEETETEKEIRKIYEEIDELTYQEFASESEDFDIYEQEEG